MIRPLSLIVTDASPLITLAAADALDCLTMANVPIIIPDMVHYEVTQDLAKLGANEAIAWMRRNSATVEIAPTQVFAEFQALRQINPATRSRGRGEAAEQELLNASLEDDPTTQAILFYEDSNVRRGTFLRTIPAGVTALTTGDLLHELELAGKIQSKDRILDAATMKDRNVTAQRQTGSSDEARAVLERCPDARRLRPARLIRRSRRSPERPYHRARAAAGEWQLRARLTSIHIVPTSRLLPSYA